MYRLGKTYRKYVPAYFRQFPDHRREYGHVAWYRQLLRESVKIVYGDLVKNHDYPVLETSVSDYSGIQSALLKHKPLFMHRSKSLVNRDYEDLADEVLQIVEVE